MLLISGDVEDRGGGRALFLVYSHTIPNQSTRPKIKSVRVFVRIVGAD